MFDLSFQALKTSDMAACVTGNISAITEENEFFFRICQLLMDQGVSVMRNEFDQIHPPHTLDNVLQMCKSTLTKLSKKTLTAAMWNVLYPGVNIYGSSSDFDITLLSVLFRNICHLQPPVVDASGKRSWDKDPLQSDTTLEADIVRLRLLRNRIYAHTIDISMSAMEFDNAWSDITQILVRRGGHAVQMKINALRKAPFTKIEELFSKHLQDWYLQDQDVKKELESLNQKLDDTQDEVSNIGSSVSALTGELKDTFCEVMNTVGTLTDSLTDTHHRIQGMENAVNALTSKLIGLSDSHSKDGYDAVMVSTICGQLTNTHGEVKSIGSTLKGELDDTRTEVKGIRQTVSIMALKLNDVLDEIRDLRNEIDKFTHEINGDYHEIKSTGHVLDDILDRLETYDYKLDDIKNATGELKKLIERQKGKGRLYKIPGFYRV